MIESFGEIVKTVHTTEISEAENLSEYLGETSEADGLADELPFVPERNLASFNEDVELKEVTENSKTFETYEEMQKFLLENMANKPPYSPDAKDWFGKEGKITIKNIGKDEVWIYTNPEGISVPYIDGYPEFPPEVKHPFIKDLNIGEFTGNRNVDKGLYIKELKNEYGLNDIPDGYTLHHDKENGKMQLIKSEYHKEFRHAGGHSLYKGVA